MMIKYVKKVVWYTKVYFRIYMLYAIKSYICAHQSPYNLAYDRVPNYTLGLFCWEICLACYTRASLVSYYFPRSKPPPPKLKVPVLKS